RLISHWDAPAYAFFEPIPKILKIGGNPVRRAHAFKCARPGCKKSVRRFLDTRDATSTSSLNRHAVSCWGKEAVDAAKKAADLDEVREKIVGGILKTGSITTYFKRKEGSAITYSHRQHTRIETRTEIAKWTGRPGYYLPSPSTVSRDVKTVFKRSRSRIARMLQEHKGALSFATDAWTSPNHRAFVAVTVHFEHKGMPVVLLLDVVEVPQSHTGVHLAAAF
ncbi:hypothetical protein C8Q76DRAFT_595802, partial [Earliella scabrosa]